MSVTTTLKSNRLSQALAIESEKFQECYLWLEKAMPAAFFEEVSHDNLMLITHNLMGFEVQNHYCIMHLKEGAIVLTHDSADADLKILKEYSLKGIQNYRTFVSSLAPLFLNTSKKLRVALIQFTTSENHETLSDENLLKLKNRIQKKNPNISDQEFSHLSHSLGAHFLRSIPLKKIAVAYNLFFRAQKREHCQYEVYYNHDKAPSMQIVLAWKNTPKHNFLYLLARTVHRHGLVMQGVNAAYLNTDSEQNTLVMTIGLHGADGKEVWEVADIPEFLRELITVKYFDRFDLIEEKLVRPAFISGSMGNFLRAAINFIHQALVHIDSNIYTTEHIEWDLCRLPEITKKICEAFRYKFHPDLKHLPTYEILCGEVFEEIAKLDTSHVENDARRKNVLTQAMNLVIYTLKTNFYLYNYSALSFRLDPSYLDAIPFERKKHFPVLPFGIFYIKGMHFFGFHIRFKDLSRGGLRTVFPEYSERMQYECDHIFSECYNLAYTQQKKNKDIPEGGSKGVIFLEPHKPLEVELKVLEMELEGVGVEADEIAKKLAAFKKLQHQETLYQAQRAYIINLMSIINYKKDGILKERNVIDYWKRPESIYLGPDENMHESTLNWIAAYSKMKGYRPGISFITSKPLSGINHKTYGVTSSGVNVYMDSALRFLNINPEKEFFTVKMSGGPGGDVAGNQILNLYKFYPETAHLLALTDGTGTIYDPEGLDLSILAKMFSKGEDIHKYPPQKLHEHGFLVDKYTKENKTAYIQQTLCYRKKGGTVIKEWLGGSEINKLLRHSVHSIKTDVFIPAGGRPRTLNENNWKDFLDQDGIPTSKAIIEGANLYFDDTARDELEKKGVLIIKDSSANKAGVVCSSYEALLGLAISEELFIEHKEVLVEEILEIVKKLALKEAQLLLRTHEATGEPLTVISERISSRINKFCYEMLEFLETRELPKDPMHPLIKTYLDYCPPTLVRGWQEELLSKVPKAHIKAIISASISSQIVYNKGLKWTPTIIDTLPQLENL